VVRNRVNHQPHNRWWHQGWLLGLLLAAITLSTYLPVWRHSYLRFDDADYVTDNGRVLSGLTWAGIQWAFTTFHSSNWHPLTWLSHMLDAQLFGPGPAGPHAVNLIFHILNTLLLFVLLRRLSGAVWRSALVAALFALHPLHVESVAWVAERKDVLSAFFFLLTLMAYGKYVSGERQKTNIQHPMPADADSSCATRITFHASRWYWLCLLFFALGLMSKPMLVTLPFVLLLLDYWPLQRFTIYDLRFTIWPLIREKIPFFLLCVASCMVTFAAQKHGGAVRSLTSFPISERIGNALVAYAQYLGKLFWPVDLAIFYPHPGQWPVTQIVLAAILIVGLCLAAVWLGRRFPFAAMGWFWFLGTLVPTIGLVQVSNQSMADRYTYLPYIGVFIILAWGAAEVLASWQPSKSAFQNPRSSRRQEAHNFNRQSAIGNRQSDQNLLPPSQSSGATSTSSATYPKGLTVLAGIAAGLVVIACAARTHDQLRHWRDGESLFRHALAVTERNFVAENNLGNVLMDKGRADEAIACLEKALELQPDFALAHNNLGNALLRKGRVDEAIAQYQKTLVLKPDYANACNNLGTAFRQKGLLDEAIACYRNALKIHPHHAKAHNNLGDVLLQQGQVDEAAAHFQKAVEIQPDFADAHHNLGVIMMQKGRVDEASGYFKKVVELRSEDAEAHNNLGFCLMQAGRADEGVGHFQRSLEIRPGFAEAHNNLGVVLLEKGRVREAVTHLQTAATLQPDNARTLSILAWVLATCPDASVRSGTKAVELAERANRLADGQDPLTLRSLAAALAEAGRFAEAMTTARRALQLTEAQSNAMLAGMLRAEMKCYQAGSPFRDNRAANGH
jgi:tetratricopeptide (TPR) repeat protein